MTDAVQHALRAPRTDAGCRVGIGLPLLSLKTRSLVTLCQNLIQTHAQMALLVVEGAYIQHNRALLVKHAREQRCTHLFFMDHDVFFPGDTVDRLLAHEKDIVAAPYNMRGVWPPQTMVFLAGPDGQRTAADQFPKELFRCEALGCGCMLIRMAVFESIAAPWFALDVRDNELVSSEDVWFCNQARRAGFDIWCDPTIPVGHIGEWIY
jgi:hypothetical protein